MTKKISIDSEVEELLDKIEGKTYSKKIRFLIENNKQRVSDQRVTIDYDYLIDEISRKVAEKLRG